MQAATDVKYISHSFKYRPGKNAKLAGGARQKQARKLAADVLRLLETELEIEERNCCLWNPHKSVAKNLNL
jgi:hypothetical protein